MVASLSVRLIHKVGVVDPKGANPGENDYSRISDIEYDSDEEQPCENSDSESEDDSYPETASDVSEYDHQVPSEIPEYIRKRMNRSPNSVIFSSVLQEEEFLPE